MQAFFEPLDRMQTTLSVLCEAQHSLNADPVTHTVLAMMTAPVHVQLTAVGWQPFKGKELTYPFQMMSLEQKKVITELLTGEQSQQHWNVYEHAITYRQKAPLAPLKATDVLEAMCTTILKSVAYVDRRVRVAVCNILLQRVQVNLKVDKATLRALNAKLFPPPDVARPDQAV